MRFLIRSFIITAGIFCMPDYILAQGETGAVSKFKWKIMPYMGVTTFANETGFLSPPNGMSPYKDKSIVSLGNDKVAAMVQFAKESYGVISLDADSRVLWETHVKGIPIVIGKIKENILLVTATGYGELTEFAQDYTGYIISPDKGKVLFEKNFYKAQEEFREDPLFLFSPDQSFVKFAIRKTSHPKVLSLMTYSKQNRLFFEETRDFTIYNLDEHLELTDPVKPVLSSGYYGGGVCNSKGDVFIRTLKADNSIELAKYEPGQSQPILKLTQAINSKEHDIHSYMELSARDPELVYVANTYNNTSKQRALLLSAYNFKESKINSVAEIFTKTHVKELEKSFTPVNKKFDGADLNRAENIRVQKVIETSESLILSLGTLELISYPNAHPTYLSTGFLINCYDNKLSLKYQQVIPRAYSLFANIGFNLGLHINAGTLQFVANTNDGPVKMNTIFGTLDIATGKILKIENISKKDVAGSYALEPLHTLWLRNGFILTYLEPNGFLRVKDMDTHLKKHTN